MIEAEYGHIMHCNKGRKTLDYMFTQSSVGSSRPSHSYQYASMPLMIPNSY